MAPSAGDADSLRSPEICFFERDPGAPLARRAVAEGVGTLFLMLAATGAGLAMHHLAPDAAALDVLASAAATAGALVGLILAFDPVSGAHFNPLITGLQWLAGERGPACTAAYVLAQIAGAAAGALLAAAIFESAGQGAGPPPSGTLAVSELLATAGLMVVVFGCARGGRGEAGPFAVGAWLAAAIIATPSTSYANPAVALGATLAAGPIVLPPSTALLYAAAEIAGALLAYFLIAITYPRRTSVGRGSAAVGAAKGAPAR